MRIGRALLMALLVTLLTALAPFAALAEEELVSLAIATVDGASGDEVDLTVALGNCEAVDSLQCNLNYDANALSVVRVTPGTAFPAEYCVSNAAEPGRVRVACACATGLSNEDGGTLLTVTFKLLSATGSAVTLSDVIVTRVDAEYVQTRAYLEVASGGVSSGGAALPAPVTTPWIAETPAPTPSPVPTPTVEPTPVVIADETPVPTLTPAPAQAANRAMLPYLIVGVFAVLAVAAIAIVLITGSKAARRRRKKRRRKKKQSAHARRD